MGVIKNDDSMKNLLSNQYNNERYFNIDDKIKTDAEITINVLRESNEKLRKEHAILIQKANKLIDAYRRLEAENQELKVKKIKHDSVLKLVDDVKIFFKKLYEDIVKWLNT